MKFIISDLLDTLQEVNVDIQTHSASSAHRIKELTMKKIHTQGSYPRKPRGLGLIHKVLIAAVLITLLAIPALAASGTPFTDWLEGILVPNDHVNDYDTDLLVGGNAKKWEVSGWVVDIHAEECSPTGLIFVCQELGNPDKSGSLKTDGTYWLESWNGSGYVAMEESGTHDGSFTILSGSTQRWDIRWEAVYGTLEPGSYRLGKAFTYTGTDGSQEELTFYAKFRIFSGDMDALLTQYRTGFDALHARESYHLTETFYYADRPNPYAHHYTQDVWKSGSDYLELIRYYKADGTLKGHQGYLYRDGVGYKLSWEDGNALSAVTSWENVDFLDDAHFDGWHRIMDVIPSILGQAYDAGDTLYFITYSDFINEELLTEEQKQQMTEETPYWNYDFTEMAYRFDENGNLVYIQESKQNSLDPAVSDLVVIRTLEVQSTTPEEIARIISMQNVTDIPAFSWEEDQAEFGSNALTGPFVNTTTQAIDSALQAINVARAEADPTTHPRYRELSEYNIVRTYYDKAAGMWKIQFYFSQDETFCLLVYMNDQGVTQMLVYP